VTVSAGENAMCCCFGESGADLVADDLAQEVAKAAL